MLESQDLQQNNINGETNRVEETRDLQTFVVIIFTFVFVLAIKLIQFGVV